MITHFFCNFSDISVIPEGLPLAYLSFGFLTFYPQPISENDFSRRFSPDPPSSSSPSRPDAEKLADQPVTWSISSPDPGQSENSAFSSSGDSDFSAHQISAHPLEW
ncbi:hypothetical protein CDAR_30241 [Caerostris darwini]|uniref:Uncharacterized protein n=1 Tax=Caerostris darwini TaxID=1538125 RepID=A0AAV4Q779_9ARAC|nr:hypothetical protein CDAR_30241 [Caerostris darwini]